MFSESEFGLQARTTRGRGVNQEDVCVGAHRFDVMIFAKSGPAEETCKYKIGARTLKTV
jgi:hypothetical protein